MKTETKTLQEYTQNTGFKQLLYVVQTSTSWGKGTSLKEAISAAKLHAGRGSKLRTLDIYHLKTDLLKNQVNKESVMTALNSIQVSDFTITEQNEFVYRISSEKF